ncbi:cation:proton antiporter [Candidatus Gracilibacteria bacterium]|nr:cation:proton antiporter [Candidatus Gracilibacteria bacterium]
MSLLVEMGIIIITAAVAGIGAYFLKQPLILAYILGGVLVGPYGLGLVNNTEFIHVVSDMGIMLMLFLVGIEMSLIKVKELGSASLVIGGAQILFTAVVAFGIAELAGFSWVASSYIAVALTLSSTVVAVKALSDQKTINSLYGKIVVGVLIIQDMVAILSLVFLNSIAHEGSGGLVVSFVVLLIKGALLAGISIFGLKRVLSALYFRIAHSTELLILASLSWCFLIALIAQYLGFSREMGAFIAGLGLANLPYAMEISSKTRILRDFFITTFFVSLGAGMVFSGLVDMIGLLVVLSLYVIIISPLIVFAIMRFKGFDPRSSFFAGISIGQVSEFSLILIALGSSLGHIDQQIVSLISIVTIITISSSSYLVNYGHQLYSLLQPILKLFPSRKKVTMSTASITNSLFEHIVLVGCGSGGHQLLDTLLQTKRSFIVIDHDPQVIRELTDRGINCIFGDVHDEELYTTINLAKADMVISLLPRSEDNYTMIKHIKALKTKKKPVYIATSNTGREGFQLFRQGADYIIVKSSLEAYHIHQIHNHLYGIKDVAAQPTDANEHFISLKELKLKILQDKEYAQIVHNLSEVRLAEIKKTRKKPTAK